MKNKTIRIFLLPYLIMRYNDFIMDPENTSFDMNLANVIVTKRREEKKAFFEAAYAGKLGDLEQYDKTHDNCGHLEKDKRALLGEMIKAPEKFVALKRVFNVVTDKGFGFHPFFQEQESMTLGTIIGTYKLHPTPETASIAAVVVSEFLRLKLLDNINYKIDMADMFKDIDGDKSTLRDAAAKASARDSVIAVQNSLVDYVYENGRTLPINRGAAMLYYFENDVEAAGNQDAVDLWTRKITTFREGSRFSAKSGEIKYVRPQYNM